MSTLETATRISEPISAATKHLHVQDAVGSEQPDGKGQEEESLDRQLLIVI